MTTRKTGSVQSNRSQDSGASLLSWWLV